MTEKVVARGRRVLRRGALVAGDGGGRGASDVGRSPAAAVCVHHAPGEHRRARPGAIAFRRPDAADVWQEVLQARLQVAALRSVRASTTSSCATPPGLFGALALWAVEGALAVTQSTGGERARPHPVRTTSSAAGCSDATGRGWQAGRAYALTHFIAHEVAHAMTVDHVGRWHFRKLAAFQTEGYADDSRLRPRAGPSAHERDAPCPRTRSRWTRAARASTAATSCWSTYLLQRRGISVDGKLLARADGSTRDVEAEPAGRGPALSRVNPG